MIRGRRRDVGLGGFPLVSLKEARDKAFSNRKAARGGGDPVADRQRPDTVPTFADAAERVWTDKHPGWRHPRHAHDWLSSLTRHVLPHIGATPVSSVSSADVLDTLRRIWHVRPETARRVRQRISAVLDWAVAMEYRSDNPCDRLGPLVFPSQGGKPISITRLPRLLQESQGGRRAARLPVIVPGLGRGTDESSARGGRGGARACGGQPDRGGVRPLGPVRAPAPADGRVGDLSEWGAQR